MPPEFVPALVSAGTLLLLLTAATTLSQLIKKRWNIEDMLTMFGISAGVFLIFAALNETLPGVWREYFLYFISTTIPAGGFSALRDLKRGPEIVIPASGTGEAAAMQKQLDAKQ